MDEPWTASGVPVVDLRGPMARRPALMVLGTLLVLGSAFAGAITVWAGSTKIAVLTLQTDLARGDILAAEDLAVVEIEPSPSLVWVPVEQQNELIGLVARGPIERGQLLSPAQFGDRGAAIGDGRVVVAIAVTPGDIPLSTVAGDLVRLQITGRSAEFESTPSSVVVAEAVVWSISPPTTGAGPVLVSLLVSEENETVVTEAAASGRMKVNLVGVGS